MSVIHHVILTLLFLIVGCCVGSFVNVCASRIPRGLSVLWPRSHCPRCRTAILAHDNVPIFGWLFLRGRCRACAAAIPCRYFLVELAIGLAFAAVYVAGVGFARVTCGNSRAPRLFLAAYSFAGRRSPSW